MNQFIRPRPVDAPGIRLLVFHHAGGSAVMYAPLAAGLPADWDLVLVDMPGRGRRHQTPALARMPELVDAVTRDVLAWAGPPLALFGHSLGAVLAVEIARRLSSMAAPPVWVGVSGRPGPARHIPAGPRSDLTDDQLMRELSAAGGMSRRIEELPGFRDRFLSLLRTDLRALESYRPDPARVPLPCPLTGFGGRDDRIASPADVGTWAEETSAGFRQVCFDGGHFYFLGPGFGALSAALAIEIAHARSGRFAAGARMAVAPA